MRYAKKVKCTHCGVETDLQPPGDGCHACGKGVMRWFPPLAKTADIHAEIIEGAGELEDGETGMRKCIDEYCEKHGIAFEVGEAAYHEWFKREAMSHGIPESVVDGKTKLSDHFSREYIDSQCGRKSKAEGE